MSIAELRAARDAAVRGPVRRTYDARLSVRAGSKGSNQITLDGYASTTEQPYEMWDMFGSYQEVISKGAFAKTLSEKPDVAFLLNHGGMTLARTAREDVTGTLELEEDDVGLHPVATLDTRIGAARDIQVAVERGDLDEMSFAFRIDKYRWSPDYSELRIDEIILHRGDVSVVNFGANPTTSIAQRSADVLRYVDGLDDTQLSELEARIRARRTPAQGLEDLLIGV
jgi:HK97 family phage prohead protease